MLKSDFRLNTSPFPRVLSSVRSARLSSGSLSPLLASSHHLAEGRHVMIRRRQPLDLLFSDLLFLDLLFLDLLFLDLLLSVAKFHRRHKNYISFVELCRVFFATLPSSQRCPHSTVTKIGLTEPDCSQNLAVHSTRQQPNAATNQ